jgi:hypothetical protein
LRNTHRQGVELEQPQLGYDHASETVMLFYTQRVPTPQGEGCDAGELNENGFWLINSTDGGSSWSAPRDVQATLRDKPTFSAKGCMAPNAGQGVQLRPGSPHAGRLLFGGQSDSYNGSVVVFSDDGWHYDWTDSLHKSGLDECSLAQLPNGSVMAIMRNCHGQQCQLRRQPADEMGARAVGSKRFVYAVSTDGGVSFGAIEEHRDLVTPVCEASLLGYNGSLLFVGPYSEVRRENLTVLASDDNGRSFRRSLRLDPGGAGYSSLQCGLPAPQDCAVLYNNEGYALGKGGSDLVFRRFSSARVKSDDASWSQSSFASPPPVGLAALDPFIEPVEFFTATGGRCAGYGACTDTHGLPVDSPKGMSAGVTMSTHHSIKTDDNLLTMALALLVTPAAAKLGVPPRSATSSVDDRPRPIKSTFDLPDGPPWPELGATPIMAYNGWLASTAFMGYNNETLYYNIVDQLVKTGLREAGYTHIGVTCNGWIRDPSTHRLTLPTTGSRAWPRGFKALVDYAHKNGLKLSAYTDTGKINCCGEPGSFGNEELDVQTFADYGVDHVAVDNCRNGFGGTQSVLEYKRFYDALVKVGHPMVYGIWSVGMGKPWAWASKLGHYYRTAGDLGNRWGQDNPNGPSDGAGIMYNYDIQQAIPGIAAQTKPGSFPLLDELMVGMPVHVPHGQGDIGLTMAESRTHFAIWCMMASPLWM